MKQSSFYFRLLKRLSKPAGLIIIILLWIFFQFAFNGLFSVSTKHISEISGGKQIPDLLFYYTPGELRQTFEAFGNEGLSEYTGLQIVDMFYPPVYGLLLASLLFLGFGTGKNSRVVLLPLFAVLFDYLENFSLRYLAIGFPDFNRGIAHAAAIFTAWKWIFVYSSIIFILIAFFRWLWYKLVRH